MKVSRPKTPEQAEAEGRKAYYVADCHEGALGLHDNHSDDAWSYAYHRRHLLPGVPARQRKR